MEHTSPPQPFLPAQPTQGFLDFQTGADLHIEEDVSHVLEAGHSSSSRAIAPAAWPPSTAVARNIPYQRHRHQRRGHSKSRGGCRNCKQRRIKCQESRPACGHCVKHGLRCEYADVVVGGSGGGGGGSGGIIRQPSNQTALFSLQDMRLFQHFLLDCLPSHPLGNESIWRHEVACLSHNHEFLMHAILGLAASSLMAQDGSVVTAALAHRLQAIRAIKNLLDGGGHGGGDGGDGGQQGGDMAERGNALMAASFALTFQSVLLEDGMAEFMTFCRGIVLVAMRMYFSRCRFLFHDFIGAESLALLRPLMCTIPPIRRVWTDMAVAAIAALGPLCRQHPVERECQVLLLRMACALHTSSFRAYEILCEHYGWWMQLPHASFRHLVDPARSVCVLLASHWIALKQIMAVITDVERQVGAEPDPDPHVGRRPGGGPGGAEQEGTARWLRYLNRQVEPGRRSCNRWPMWVQAQLDRDPAFFREDWADEAVLMGGVVMEEEQCADVPVREQ